MGQDPERLIAEVVRGAVIHSGRTNFKGRSSREHIIWNGNFDIPIQPADRSTCRVQRELLAGEFDVRKGRAGLNARGPGGSPERCIVG